MPLNPGRGSAAHQIDRSLLVETSEVAIGQAFERSVSDVPLGDV